MQNIIEPFKNAMLDSIGAAPDTIVPDGHLHRFKIDRKLTGWYSLHIDGKAAGAFGDWKQGINERWKMAGTFKKLTDAERQAFAIERQRQNEQRQTDADQPEFATLRMDCRPAPLRVAASAIVFQFTCHAEHLGPARRDHKCSLCFH